MSDDWGLGVLDSRAAEPKWEVWYAWRPVRVGVRKVLTNTSNVHTTVTRYEWWWLMDVARQKVRRAELPGNWWIYRYAPPTQALLQR